MIYINNQCKHSVDNAWCNNKKVKKSLFGYGARCCKIYPNMDEEMCEYIEKRVRPKYPPPRGGSGVIQQPIKVEVTIINKDKL